MTRERWGTFSVRDHTRKRPFAAEALMYDRLVVPRFSDDAERARWSEQGWAPRRLEALLEVLRANQPQGRAVTVEWNQYTRDLFRQRAEAAKIVNEEANYGLTRRLLASELLPAAPGGVVPISIVTAYPSPAAAQKEWVPNSADERAPTLTLALAHRFLVPDPTGKTDLELLTEAVALSDDASFRRSRARMYEWQEDVIRRGISDPRALEEMADYVHDYNESVRAAERKVWVRLAFSLVPVALTGVTGPIAPAVGAGYITELVRFWIFDRKPVVQAGESEVAAMFHSAREKLGWRSAPPTA